MASEVFFTTSAAEFTKLEGLYVSERNPPGFIRGRDMSVVGFAGRCVRGPLTPQEITSPARFLEVYGGRDQGAGGTLIGEVWAALLNKNFGKIVVRRVAAAAAALATFTADDTAGAGGTNIVRIDAANVGAWGNNVTFSVEAASDAVSTHWNLKVKYLGKEYLFKNLNTTAGNDNLSSVIGTDIGTLVRVTKLADGRPHNQADTALASGADGTLAASDYVTGITDIANFPGVNVALIPDSTLPTPATVNAAIVTLAAAATDRDFLTWSGVHGQSSSTEKTTKTTQITTTSDRIFWCYNSPETYDPEAKALVRQAPHVWLAAILSQTDVDIHPGSHETAKYLAGVASVYNDALTRAELIDLRDAGICTLERLPGEFLFRSAVTTDLTAGKTEIARRRCADFLQLSASDRLKYFVKAKNTRANRAQMMGELTAFSQSLKSQERIIEDFVIESDSVNTTIQRGQGIEKLFWRVRLIGHILHLVLETEIGTGVTIATA